MSSEAASSLCDRVLMNRGIEHGFGRKGSQPPEKTVFSRQVHGVQVLEVESSSEAGRAEADALVTAVPGVSIGVVTADCVPILAAAVDGSAVAAIHAGWRGLASGVIEAGLAALRARSAGGEWIAAVGPAARGCCYEVDAPVCEALSERYAEALPDVLVPGRTDRFQLDLPALATWILRSDGLPPDRIGVENRLCTICDRRRFESYRRDGDEAGRLSHFIRCPAPDPVQG